MTRSASDPDFDDLAGHITNCRICVEKPCGKPLPQEPKPVFRASQRASIILAGQAPGTRVHASGVPFTDPSGDRLRFWLGLSSEQFYDLDLISIIPMGFCFPGLDAHGGDLPPRPECRATWHDQVFATVQPPHLLICVGYYAIKYHLIRLGLRHLLRPSLTEVVAHWQQIRAEAPYPLFALPHPSWRNSGWLKKNPWFETALLPVLRHDVAAAIAA